MKNNKTCILSVRDGSNIIGQSHVRSRILSIGRRLATGWRRDRNIY
jgi:hypothetical protein